MSLKGYFKVTGQVSQRHPFHGSPPDAVRAYIEPDIYDFDVASIDKAYKSYQGYGLDASGLYQGLKTPFWGGLAAGATAYFLTRLVARDNKIAARVGLVTGGVHILMSALHAHLEKQVQDAIAAGQPVAQTTDTTQGNTVTPAPTASESGEYNY